jgi:hypothetical protein
MNKRSATFIAATLVGVLALGGLAFSMGLTGPTASAAAGPRSTTTRQAPTVHTQTRTVIVHRQATASAPQVVTISSSNSGPSSSSGPSTSSGPGHDGSDDGVEHEEGGGDQGQDNQGQDDGPGHDAQDDHGGSDDD